MTVSSGPRTVDRATSTFLGLTSLWPASTTRSGSWTTAVDQATRFVVRMDVDTIVITRRLPVTREC